MQTRNGFTRGSRPVRPGDLTGRLFNEDTKRAEEARNATDLETVRRTAYRTGFDAGHEAGFSAGLAWVAENFDVFDKSDEDQGDEADEDQQ